MPFVADHRPQRTGWFVFEATPTENFRVLIRRVLAENLYAFRAKGAIGTDPKAFDRWMKFLAEEVVLDWDGIIDKDGAALPATTETKGAFLREWDTFKNWVEAKALDEAQFLGNGVGGSGSPDGGETPAAQS